MLRIRISGSGSHAFDLIADPDPGSQTNADSGQKLNFYMKKIFKVGNKEKKYLRRCKSLFERQQTRLILVNFKCYWIRIRVANTDLDPDPGQPNQCGSGFGCTTLSRTISKCHHY
jgi:hypothetical protein